MNKFWKSPILEVLAIKKTMASSVDGPYTDEAYVPGERVDPNNPSTWKRFTS